LRLQGLVIPFVILGYRVLGKGLKERFRRILRFKGRFKGRLFFSGYWITGYLTQSFRRFKGKL